MFESDAEAAEALAAANVGEVTSPGDVPQTEQAPVSETQDTSVDQGATSEDTLESIDLSSLTPEARAAAEQAIRQMQGDYTRKTQAIAPIRKAIEEFGMDADTAREALAFVQALKDPTNLQALYQRLDSEFGTAEFQSGEEFESEEADPRDQLLAQVQQRLDDMERRAIEAEVQADLDRQEAIIRSENPNYSDDDLNTIAQLAIPLQGDLVKAAESYKALQQRIIGSHLQGKAQVSAGVTGLPGTSHAETPTKFADLDEAHAAALRTFAEELAN